MVNKNLDITLQNNFSIYDCLIDCAKDVIVKYCNLIEGNCSDKFNDLSIVGGTCNNMFYYFYSKLDILFKQDAKFSHSVLFKDLISCDLQQLDSKLVSLDKIFIPSIVFNDLGDDVELYPNQTEYFRNFISLFDKELQTDFNYEKVIYTLADMVYAIRGLKLEHLDGICAEFIKLYKIEESDIESFNLMLDSYITELLYGLNKSLLSSLIKELDRFLEGIYTVIYLHYMNYILIITSCNFSLDVNAVNVKNVPNLTDIAYRSMFDFYKSY